MNDLLFYALIIALLYYFLIYLPQQKKQLAPIKLTQSQETQTQTPSEENNQKLEPLLDKLLQQIQTLNKELDHPPLTELQQALEIATKKLAGELPWEDWETKEGLTNYLQELTQQIKALTKKK